MQSLGTSPNDIANGWTIEGMMQQHYEKCVVIFTRVSLNDMLAPRA